jgi:hypothetical protein
LGVALAALGAGPRDAPARQHTLRATLDWSHELLDDGEKACFARLAVFAGGATVEAAQAITGADLDTLDRLVAKSLVVRRQRQGSTRLMMLETVRAYAAERFAALADGEAVRERHFDYFLSVARRHGIDSALDGPDAAEHLACLDAELQNFRAALHWAAERDAAERVLALAAALIDYWLRRDLYAEAADWALPALRNPATKIDPVLRARALAKACWPLRFLGRDDEVLELIREAEMLAGAVGNLVIRAEVLYSCAAIKAFTGRADEARATADQALATAEASGDRWTTAMAAWARTMAADSDRELRERIDEAASRLADVGNGYHLATLYMNAVTSAWLRGSDAEAARYLEPAVALARRLGQRYVWLCVVSATGLVALSSGDTKAADAAFREALELSHDLVLLGPAIVALTGLASVAALAGEPEHAARLAGAVAVNLGDMNEADIIGRLRAGFLEPAGISSDTDAALAAAHPGAALSIQQATLYALEHPPVEIDRHTLSRQASASYAG